LGNHSVANGDLNEAKLHFQKASDLDQNFVLAYFHLAKILTNPSEYDQAYRNYETALEIKPDLSECHYWFAKLLASGEKLKTDGSLIREPEINRAKDHLSKAIKINKKFAKAYFKLGLLLVEDGEYIDAMKNFESAITFNKDFAEAHYQIALLLMDEKASKILSKAKPKKAKTSK
jgi:tetratricopeptide (TPR) repeat protein